MAIVMPPKFTPLVTVAGFGFPEPSSYEATSSDFVDAGRNLEGVTIGALVRNDVAKVSMSWKYVPADIWAQMLQCFIRKFGGDFYNYVTFYNQTIAGWETRYFYVNDRTSGLWQRDPRNGDIRGWTSCKLNLIEV
jgi:hypothetical protein